MRSTDEEQPDWNHIVDTHVRRIVQIAFKILGSEHDAEEVAQEVFTEAFQVHQREIVRDWTGLLVRLATLRSLDRRRTRKETVSLDRLNESGSSLSDSLEESELKEWLRAQIAQLPDRQAAVITLISLEGLSREEVAMALQITPENVSATLYQARCRLKEALLFFLNEDHDDK